MSSAPSPTSAPSTPMTRPDSESSVASMFDRIAGRYDFLNRTLSARQDVRWRKHLIDLVPYRPQGTFLDMATGTGDVILAAAASHPEYADFIGADISTGMMKHGADKANHQLKSGMIKHALTWRTMSAENILLEDQSCDCVSISFGLRNVVYKANALNEFSRVLKNGGVLLILEFFTPQGGIMSRLFQFYFHYILPIIGRLFSEKEAYSYLPKSVASFYTPSELREELRNRNFRIDVEKNFLFGACRLVRARKIDNVF